MEKEFTVGLAIPQRIERLPITSYQKKISFIIILAVFFENVDMGAIVSLLPPLMKAFSLKPAMAGLLGSMSFAGMLVGALVAGKIADKIGRRLMLQWSMVIWGVSGLMIAVSWNITFLMIFRFLLGVGLGAEHPVANAMLSEFLPKKSRGAYLTFMQGLGPIAIIVGAIAAYYIVPWVGWRWVFVLEAAPAAWLFFIRRALPESPRWLEAIGRKEAAEKITSNIESEVERRYGRPLPPVPSIVFEEKGIGSTYAELWSKEYFRRTLMLCILWPTTLFGYWAINVWLTALLVGKGFAIVKSIEYLIWMMCAGIPGFLCATYLIERIGRKPLVIGAVLGCGVTAYLYGNAASLTTLIFWGLLMQFFMWNMWPSIFAYTPELYASRMRATGTGFCMAVGRIGAILGPYVTGLIVASKLGQPMVFVVGAAAFVVGAFAVFILAPETRGKILEEIGR